MSSGQQSLNSQIQRGIGPNHRVGKGSSEMIFLCFPDRPGETKSLEAVLKTSSSAAEGLLTYVSPKKGCPALFSEGHLPGTEYVRLVFNGASNLPKSPLYVNWSSEAYIYCDLEATLTKVSCGGLQWCLLMKQ